MDPGLSIHYNPLSLTSLPVKVLNQYITVRILFSLSYPFLTRSEGSGTNRSDNVYRTQSLSYLVALNAYPSAPGLYLDTSIL